MKCYPCLLLFISFTKNNQSSSFKIHFDVLSLLFNLFFLGLKRYTSVCFLRYLALSYEFRVNIKKKAKRKRKIITFKHSIFVLCFFLINMIIVFFWCTILLVSNSWKILNCLSFLPLSVRIKNLSYYPILSSYLCSSCSFPCKCILCIFPCSSFLLFFFGSVQLK